MNSKLNWRQKVIKSSTSIRNLLFASIFTTFYNFYLTVSDFRQKKYILFLTALIVYFVPQPGLFSFVWFWNSSPIQISSFSAILLIIINHSEVYRYFQNNKLEKTSIEKTANFLQNIKNLSLKLKFYLSFDMRDLYGN